jgi:hypothetical protein
MKKFVCDRCGGDVATGRNLIYGKKEYDLCNQCMTFFYRFMNELKDNPESEAAFNG